MAFFRKENIKNLQDEELISRFTSSGDIDLIGELISRYTHLVDGVCLKYLENREDAKDAVMEIFEKLVAEISRHDIRKFSSWLYVISKNYCLMQIRTEKAEGKHKTRWLNNEQVFMENDAFLHPIDETKTDIDIALKNCIEKLKNEQKYCIELFYFKNKCYQEIAGELKTDEKKVKSYLQNAKRNLKICLDQQNEKGQ